MEAFIRSKKRSLSATIDKDQGSSDIDWKIDLNRKTRRWQIYPSDGTDEKSITPLGYSASVSSNCSEDSCSLPLTSSDDETSTCSGDFATEAFNVGHVHRATVKPSATESLPSSPMDSALPSFISDSHYMLGEKKIAALAKCEKSPLLLLGSDVMAQILIFLDPVEILSVLNMPLCKDWQQCYTSHRDLWKVLCYMEPFKLDDRDETLTNEDEDYALSNGHASIDRYRIMYTSFVRCMKYLKQIKQDVRNGVPLSVIDCKHSSFPHLGGNSKCLKRLLAGKKTEVLRSPAKNPSICNAPIGVLAEDPITRDIQPIMSNPPKPSRKIKHGNSMITSRLLGPSAQGKPSFMNLPQSCAIFSIANWMVAYPKVEGIQIMCIESLPSLLENEQQRNTAQRAGLVEVLLKSILSFPDSLKLHVAAFHTLVLLGRPLGGREGMLIDIVDRQLPLGGVAFLDRGSGERLTSFNKISIFLNSMRNFAMEESLQAMACWALVNLALVPSQKSILIKLGGIQATLEAMKNHSSSFAVQFRALFALINLVVPVKRSIDIFRNNIIERGDDPSIILRTEKDILDGNIGAIAKLAVIAVENFPSCETIRSRACLVLHNLSITKEYLPILLWTEQCYNLLGWCANRKDSNLVLKKSALSAMKRIQELLGRDESLRQKFIDWNTAIPNFLSFSPQQGAGLASSNTKTI